jgi:hypothetical protein
MEVAEGILPSTNSYKKLLYINGLILLSYSVSL